MAVITTIKPRGIDVTGNYVVTGLSATGNVSAGNVKTDHLLYANGSPYVFTTTAGGSNTQIQFNDASSFAGSANLTFDKTSNTLTVTNISANGAGLTSLAGANVTGFVPNANVANTAYSVAGANVTGAVSYATTANSVAGANVSGAVAYATTANSVAGSNVSGAVGLATYATTANAVAGANVSGAVSYATTANSVAGANVSGQVAFANVANNVAGANVSGFVANANVANTAYAVAGANVTGQVGNALVAGTVYTASQSNITSVGTLTGLTVSGLIIATGTGIKTANIQDSTGTITITTKYNNNAGDVGITGNLTIGVGGAGNVIANGNVNVTSTTNATGTGTGAFTTPGGASIGKDLYVGGTLYVPNLASTNTTTLNVTAPLLYLNANTPYPYNYDIGTYSDFATSSGSGAGNGYQHTGFVRNHSDNAWYLFSNLPEPTGGTIDLTNANIVYDAIKVGKITSYANIIAVNANLGNAVNANYFIGSGNNLSNIQGANVSGFVPNANVANTAYAVSGSNVSGAVAYATTANSVAGANVSGFVANANVANTAYAVSGSNVSGQVGNALVAGTVYTSAQPNITSTGTLTGLTVTGNVALSGANVSLGAVGNLHITGGTANQFLQTDGSGNLTWATASSGALGMDVDNFTGNGVQTAFTLSKTPTSANYTIATIQGVVQPRSYYTVSGSTLTFSTAPPDTSVVEITTISGNASGSSGGSALTWNIVTTNTTMTKNNGYFVDTSSGAITMTLPATPSLGDTIRINDVAGTFSTNNLTVARNGNKIQGATNDLLVDVDQSSLGLVYSNSTYGWKVLEL